MPNSSPTLTTVFPFKSIHLFSTNASVNAHNETVLEALTTEGCRFIAIDSLETMLEVLMTS